MGTRLVLPVWRHPCSKDSSKTHHLYLGTFAFAVTVTVACTYNDLRVTNRFTEAVQILNAALHFISIVFSMFRTEDRNFVVGQFYIKF